MADIFCKFDTGNDTTGNGSVGNPYKTLAKAISVMSADDKIKLMADETFTTGVTLPTYTDFTKISGIIGVNASGTEDGTRRRMISNGVTGQLINISANTYSWTFRNFQFEDFSNYVISSAVAWTSGFTMVNCKVLRGNGLVAASTSVRGGYLVDCEYQDCANTTGQVGGGYGFVYKRAKFENCSATTGAIVNGSTAGVILLDVVFNNCSVTSGNIATSITSAKNVFVNGCSQPTSTTNGIIQVAGGAIVENILFRNNVGNSNAASSMLRFAGNSPCNLAINIAFYGNTVFNNLITAVATTKAFTTNAPISLAADPLPSGTEVDATYPWRRFPQKIGEFNYTPSII